jgi:hypothetical protein
MHYPLAERKTPEDFGGHPVYTADQDSNIPQTQLGTDNMIDPDLSRLISELPLLW